MLKIFKVPVEPLTPAAFEPFGSVIRTCDETRPEVDFDEERGLAIDPDMEGFAGG